MKLTDEFENETIKEVTDSELEEVVGGRKTKKKSPKITTIPCLQCALENRKEFLYKVDTYTTICKNYGHIYEQNVYRGVDKNKVNKYFR